MTRLPNLIQNTIISSLFNNNIKFTLKHNLEIQYRPLLHFNNDYYKEISKYSFVCKHWFNYIRSLFNSCSSDIYWCMIHKNKFNKEYSLYQYDNIINFYLICKDSPREENVIDFIKKFSNLERLILETNNMQLVKDITTRFPTLKLELTSDEDYGDVCNFSLIESISEQSLDFVHVTVDSNIIGAHGYEELDKYIQHYKRVNSIFFHYYNGEFGLRSHLSHSDIITHKSLQYITLNDDIVYTHDLIKVVKDNDHIISFRASLPLFVYGNSDDDLDVNCSYLNNDLFLRDNKLEHWIEFCEHLAINRTLKSLHISNCCDECDHHLSKEIQQQMSEKFCLALESNQTLEYLTIPCGILTESFYHKFSSINQTIYNIQFLNVGLKEMVLIGEMMKINRTIKTLGIVFIFIPAVYTDQQHQSIESFVNALKHNQTLKTLNILQNELIYQALIKDEQLKFEIKKK